MSSPTRLRHGPATAEARLLEQIDRQRRHGEGIPVAAPRALPRIDELVTQAGHGFAVQDVVGWTGSVWAKAVADLDASGGGHLTNVALVVAAPDADHVTLVHLGDATLLPEPASVGLYYLSPTTPGLLVTSVTPTRRKPAIPILYHRGGGRCVVLGSRQRTLSLADLVEGIDLDAAEDAAHLLPVLTSDGAVDFAPTCQWVRVSGALGQALGPAWGTGFKVVCKDTGGWRRFDRVTDADYDGPLGVVVSWNLSNPGNETWDVVLAGPCSAGGLGTLGAGVATTYWADTNGGFTATRPTAGAIIPVFTHAGDRITVHGPTSPLRISEAEDVDTTGRADGEVPYWDTASGKHLYAPVDSLLGTMPALTVRANATNASAAGQDVALTADKHVLMRDGTTLVSKQIRIRDITYSFTFALDTTATGTSGVALTGGGAGSDALTWTVYGKHLVWNAKWLAGYEVDTTPPSNGQLLAYDNAASKWKPVNGLTATGDLLYRDGSGYAARTIGSAGHFLRVSGGVPVWGSASLDDLNDVVAPTPATGDFLGYNGSNWVNQTAAQVLAAIGAMGFGGFTLAASNTSTGAWSHTPTAGKRRMILVLIGAGAGGEAASGVAGASGSRFGSGGGGGDMLVLLLHMDASPSALSGSIGAGTAAGSGTAGGDTTCTTLSATARGGLAPNASPSFSSGAGVGMVSTINTSGYSGIGLRFPGRPGELQSVGTITYNGAGAVTSYASQRGRGGFGWNNPGASAMYGDGGVGGSGISGGAGANGAAFILEAD